MPFGPIFKLADFNRYSLNHFLKTYVILMAAWLNQPVSSEESRLACLMAAKFSVWRPITAELSV